jgi:glycosyltransferase involved in cell wall biosynthesis
LFYKAACHAFKDILPDTEIIFVNDGSRDKTFENLKKVVGYSESKVSVINFSRNFGKEAALLAGLKASTGEMVAIIDADMQQRPEYILDMMNILEEHTEYDAVAAYQDVRKEGKILRFFKDKFYKVINGLTEINIVQSASDFRLLRRKVVDAIISLPEKCRFSKGIFAWVGFETYYMPYTVEERANGTSKWNFWKLMAYAMDGIVAFSVKPLLISSFVGLLLCVIAVLLFIITFVKTLVFGDPVAGYPTLACLILLLSGVQLFCMGILGQYMAKNYAETKNRPVYIVKDVIESEDVKL